MKTAQESRALAQDNHINQTKDCKDDLLIKELLFISQSIDSIVESGLMSFDYPCSRYLNGENAIELGQPQCTFERNLIECLNSYGYKCDFFNSNNDYFLKISWL